MTGKKASTGCMIAIPSAKSGVVVSAGRKRGRTESFETENTTKKLYKNHGGGCSSKMTQSHKAGEFVDKGTATRGSKKKSSTSLLSRLMTKLKGAVLSTRLKFKKVTTSNNNNSSKKARVAAAPKPSASYKRSSNDHFEYY